MELNHLPKTSELCRFIEENYGLSKVQTLKLISDLNCEDIEGYKSEVGAELVRLFIASSEELQSEDLWS